MNRIVQEVCVAAAIMMVGQGALAQSGQATTVFEAAKVDLNAQASAVPAAVANAPVTSSYGIYDTMWWNMTVGASSDFDNIEDVNASIGFSYFAADDVEVGADILLRYIVQEGNDALAVNPQIYFRWHFFTSSTLLGMQAASDAGERGWTMFLEAGIGPMLSTDDVPPTSTSLNFTPRAGIGMTVAVSEKTRLLASLRWSHVSNADIVGNDDNVGSDGAMLTIGCVWAW